MRFGASTFIWASPFRDENVGPLAAKAAEHGFDVLEICIEDPALVTVDAIRSAASDAGVDISVCGAFGPDRDVSHEDPEVRRGAGDYLRTCIDLAAAVGSDNVSGPMYSATGKARLLSDDERKQQWEWAVEGIGAAADYAAEHGVGLAIEPLNRYETDLVNTNEQGVRLCQDVGRDNVGLLIDTFHMNIEEKDIGSAIRAAGGFVRNFHACENDRGTPGSGHVEWDAVKAALSDIDYDGLVVIESFTPEIKEIARAVSQWRPVAASSDALAGDGIRFLERTLRA
jgi:D-psicose/D-tagatose/L-ribulose 3-epimerase